jgi:hypothetical protein
MTTKTFIHWPRPSVNRSRVENRLFRANQAADYSFAAKFRNRTARQKPRFSNSSFHQTTQPHLCPSTQERKRTVARMTGRPSVFTSQVCTQNLLSLFFSLRLMAAFFCGPAHLLHRSMTTRKAWHHNPVALECSFSVFRDRQSPWNPY